jgi:hypothetical protein
MDSRHAIKPCRITWWAGDCPEQVYHDVRFVEFWEGRAMSPEGGIASKYGVTRKEKLGYELKDYHVHITQIEELLGEEGVVHAHHEADRWICFLGMTVDWEARHRESAERQLKKTEGKLKETGRRLEVERKRREEAERKLKEAEQKLKKFEVEEEGEREAEPEVLHEQTSEYFRRKYEPSIPYGRTGMMGGVAERARQEIENARLLQLSNDANYDPYRDPGY